MSTRPCAIARLRVAQRAERPRGPNAHPAKCLVASAGRKLQHFATAKRVGVWQALRQGSPLRAIVSALSAFLAAGLRPRTPLAKAIMLVLVIKLIGIAGMKLFMFPDGAQPVVDANAMARVIGVSPPAQ